MIPNCISIPALFIPNPIPRGGGIPFLRRFSDKYFLHFQFSQTTVQCFFAAFLALSIGLIDDKFNAQSKDVSPVFPFSYP